jgi:hypothetical protein
MKKLFLALALTLSLAQYVSADVTVSYPSKENPVFTVEAPDDWEFEAGDKDDPYCTLTKGDTVLYFRTVEGTEEKLGEAIEETYEYVKETYPKAKLPKPKELKIDGKDALVASGSGKDEDGVATTFGFAWIFVSGDHIAEVWFEAADSDKENVEAANKILNSFKAHK